MMARVRAIDGVTRVALSKSEALAGDAADRRDQGPVRHGRSADLLGRRLLRGRALLGGARAGDGHERVRRPRPQRHRGLGGRRGRHGGRRGRRRRDRVHHGRRSGRHDHHHVHDVQRGHGVTRSAKTLIPAILGVVAIAAFYFLVLSPKRDEVAKLETQIATEETAAQQAELLAKQYEAAKDNYKANYAEVARLGKAVPADDDVRSLLVQIDAAAHDSKVDFRSLNVNSAASRHPADRGRRGDHSRGRPRRQRRLLGHAVQVRVQRQLLPALGLLHPTREVRHGARTSASTSRAACCSWAASR